MEPQISLQIRPFGEKALAVANLVPGERVLDVGCGGGETTLAIANKVGPSGSVMGVDISEALLTVADKRAEGYSNVSFLLCDAQTAELAEASVDAVFSRFGVMFFADPVSAFRNLKRALVPSGRFTFVCWRAPHENEWMAVPWLAMAKHVPITPPDPYAPGPCAFADAERTRKLLLSAGFKEVEITPYEHLVSLGGAKSVDEALTFLRLVGPVSRALRGAAPETVALVMEEIRTALTPHAKESGVALNGAAWVVSARA